MHIIENYLDRMIAREGGYVNHPADRGGPTKYGITLKTLAVWRNKVVTPRDVRELTENEAKHIYRENYYRKPGIDRLPRLIQEHVFDIAVNSGPHKAVMLLQEALNILGSSLVVDGLIGRKTIGAAQLHYSPYVNNVLVHLRLGYYQSICDKRPSQNAFRKGWIARAQSFRKKVGSF